ncbi:hypothetical protein [Gimibacter soli]|uniref:Uncharacterized protein n=1 Tax=Gimibacter soli TaxID=3024400 RepID=A0AAE9XUX2_9PROT|nr:hypothetical protein [Gimibacter soli]WCL54123.1 hypothetical protein PH603_16415 [Gimibacter soli]
MKQWLRNALILFGLTLWSAQAGARDLKVAVPILSGHFDSEGQGRSRAAIDAIFKECGMTADYVLHRWGQHWVAYDDDESFDAVAIVWDNVELDGHRTEAFIHQANGVAFRADRHLKIDTVEDLAGLKVLGFGGATRLFPSLARVMPTMQSYWEAPSGFATTQALVNGDVDVFLTDGLIFAIDYMDRTRFTGARYGDTHWPAMSFVRLFPTIGDRMMFRDQAKATRFNGCIIAAREKGAIALATAPFVAPYKDIVGDQIPAD